MKRKTLTLLFALSIGAAALGVFTACRQDVLTLEDLIEDGYTCEVVFDLAGGASGSGDRAREELHQYVQPGSIVVRPGDNNYSGPAPVREGYTLGGYWTGSKDGEGNITYEKKWDFGKDKVSGNLTLYAKWLENYKLTVHYGENYSLSAEFEVSQNEDGVPSPVSEPSLVGYTALAYYADRAAAEEGGADGENALSFPYTAPFSEGEPRVEVWANTLEGEYTVVRGRQDFRLYAGTNIYLLADIDFEGAAVDFPDAYNGTFLGNGHKLSNFTVTRNSSNTNGDTYFGLFKALGGTAVLDDVTFENFTLNITLINSRSNFHYVVGALAGQADSGAKLNKVELVGTLNCSVIAEKLEETVAEPFLGEADEGVLITDCNYAAVEVNKSAYTRS